MSIKCFCMWEDCGKVFATEKETYEHVFSTHKGVGQQICKWINSKTRGACSTVLKHKGQLKDHVISHFSCNLKPFECSLCKKPLRNRQQLNTHKKLLCKRKNIPNVSAAGSNNNLISLTNETVVNENYGPPLLLKSNFSPNDSLINANNFSTENYSNFFFNSSLVNNLINFDNNVKHSDLMPSKNFEIELKKVYPVSFPVKELSQHNDSLKELCESFLNLQLDTEHSIIMNPYIKCAIGINVVFYWGICNKYVKCLKIEIPQIIKQAFVKIIKYGGMEGRVHPAIQYEFAKTVSSHSHDVDFAHNMLKVSAKNQIAMVYSRFLTNLLSNLTSQLELKKNFILLTCQRVATPSWNMISALRQFLYVIVNEYKNAILRDISNEDEFLILEAIKDTQLFRSPLDCAGQSLVLRSTLLINAKEAVKEKSACIKKFIKILSFELENLCGKYVYGKHEEDFKKLCCFGLMCGGLNSARCRLNIDLRESVNEGSNRHEFYFIFRIGFDVKFVLEPLIDFNTIGLREYFG